ncbi:MAG: tRNA lysidine(34) synthetase TilS [Candidatus Borkfalkiaceae bacterium]|nr:tRNA lysidine(34) synthetase TilS [Christensenellaceae bacterium]
MEERTRTGEDRSAFPHFNGTLFTKGQTVGVALSGGKDSVCLLSVLSENAERLGIRAVAVNVDHGIRGKASEEDSAFVRRLCGEMGIPLFFRRVDCPAFCKQEGTGTEEGARILRYRVFDEAIRSGFCDVIATAHHRSDNAETVLFRLLRGSGPSGLVGIRERDESGKIVRPLLGATREEIDRYVALRGLSFVTDESNGDDRYARNFLRNEVMPLVERRFPAAEEAICRFARLLAEDEAFFANSARKGISRRGGEIAVDRSLPLPVFSRACILALREIGIEKNYDNRHIESLFRMKTSENGRRTSLPGGAEAIAEGNYVVFLKKRETSVRLSDGIAFAEGRFSFGGKTYVVERTDGKAFSDGVKADGAQGKTLYFDGDKIPAGSVFRTRREGDRFRPFGGGGRKLKEYLIDRKIPARLREGLVLLCKDEEVIFIFGIEISDGIKVDKTTSNMLKCYTESQSEEKPDVRRRD